MTLSAFRSTPACWCGATAPLASGLIALVPLGRCTTSCTHRSSCSRTMVRECHRLQPRRADRARSRRPRDAGAVGPEQDVLLRHTEAHAVRRRSSLGVAALPRAPPDMTVVIGRQTDTVPTWCPSGCRRAPRSSCTASFLQSGRTTRCGGGGLSRAALLCSRRRAPQECHNPLTGCVHHVLSPLKEVSASAAKPDPHLFSFLCSTS
jgi:hypothetical protein